MAEFQQKTFCRFFYRLFESGEETAIGKIVPLRTLFKIADDQRFRYLIQRVKFQMHQFVNDHFFHIFPIDFGGVEQYDGFPVVAVDLKIGCFSPCGILDSFQMNIPVGRKAKFLDPFFKK